MTLLLKLSCLTGRGSELQRAYVSLIKLKESVAKLAEMEGSKEDSESARLCASEEDSEEDSESVSGSEREGPQVWFKSHNDLLPFNSPCEVS